MWAFVFAVLGPYAANQAGWVTAEVGRQPWIVYEVMRTEDGISPSLSSAEIATSLAIFIALYTVLAVTAFVLLRRYARLDPPEVSGEEKNDGPIAVAGL